VLALEVLPGDTATVDVPSGMIGVEVVRGSRGGFGFLLTGISSFELEMSFVC
jgi:hypothetical protein